MLVSEISAFEVVLNKSKFSYSEWTCNLKTHFPGLMDEYFQIQHLCLLTFLPTEA